jgi:endonuclease III-like uncharacterized protein
MSLSEDHVAHLVTALLTVNLYPVDRAAALMPAFKAKGLLDPARVAALPQDQLAEAMKDAGYARGGFLPIVSFRMYPLMEAVAGGQLDELEGAVAARDKDRFAKVLSSVHGFGPRTAETAWMLWAEG